MAEQILNEEEGKRQERKTSIREGNFSAFSSGLADNYIVPLGNAITNSALVIGCLSAIPNLLSPIAQMYGSRLMEKHSRKKIVVGFVFIHSLLWLTVALIGILGYLGYLKSYLPFLLVAAYSIIAAVGGFSGPAWFSWMGDVVSEKERGKYFSRRNRITGFSGMIAFIVGALVLDLLETKGIVLAGFAILYFGASITRFIGFLLFRKQYEPSFSLNKEEYYFTFWQFIRKNTNFAKFSFYMVAFQFAMTLAGPFYAVHMLKNLQFSYTTYMIVSLSGTIFYLLLTPLAGKFSDRYGNLKLIYIASGFFALYPVAWIFLKSPISLIFIAQLITGIATAAFAIGTNNFIYDTVTPQRRGLCVAYNNMFSGAGIFLGSLAGGLILGYAHPSFMNAFYFLFAVSAIMRASMALIFLWKVKEIRTFERMPGPLTWAMFPLTMLEEQYVYVKDFSRGLIDKHKKILKV